MSSNKAVVLALYRSVLRIHKRLPRNQRMLADSFVRHEFREHKNASADFVPSFLKSWEDYVGKISKQIETGSPLGSSLSPEIVESIDDDKRQRLGNLYSEVSVFVANVNIFVPFS